MRCWAAGSSCTSHLQQLLALHHPLHANGLLGNWQLAEGIKEAFCFASGDYTAQLRAAAAHPATAGGRGVCRVCEGLCEKKLCEKLCEKLCQVMSDVEGCHNAYSSQCAVHVLVAFSLLCFRHSSVHIQLDLHGR